MEYHIGQMEVERVVASCQPVQFERQAGDGSVGLVGSCMGQRHAPVVAGHQVNHVTPRYVLIVKYCWPGIEVFVECNTLKYGKKLCYHFFPVLASKFA